MKLFNSKPNYVRLDDDVSFQVLRTNPKLTSNVKLMYDGKDIYMESYSATPLLSTTRYKHHKVWKTGLFNRDLQKFLVGTGTSAYEVGQFMEDTIIGDSYDGQFETMYWCGAESINSSEYRQELGFVAPLYLRKKIPNYFVIFKIDNPANTNLTTIDYKDEDGNVILKEQRDDTYNFKDDILKNAKIIKAFDLREGTPIGKYIRNYVEQKDFRYDQSIYVNFSAQEIYYYGIDKSLGVLTQKVESMGEQMIDTDNTVMRTDDWITSGFERNNLIFPYILNLEFLFDDKETEEFKFARYFGMYCNDIDLYDVNVSGLNETASGRKLLVDWKDNTPEEIEFNDSSFYYIKDKNNEIYSIDSNLRIGGNVNASSLMGFENSSTSTFCERVDGIGYSTLIFQIDRPLEDNDVIYFKSDMYDGTEVIDTTTTFMAVSRYDAGEFNKTRFSCNGTVEDIASALAASVKKYDGRGYEWITAYSIGNKVIIRSIFPGMTLNNLLKIRLGLSIVSKEKISFMTDTVSPSASEWIDMFTGGTNVNGSRFRIRVEDKNMFFDTSGQDQDSVRYLKCKNNRNAKVLAVLPDIHDDKTLDENFMILVTDYNGPYVNISKTNQVEIIDKFYSKIGVLSFFPVKDFDFDTVDSIYGKDDMMQKELDDINKYIENATKDESKDITFTFSLDVDDNDDPDDWEITAQVIRGNNGKKYNKLIPYGRFFYNGDPINTEYDYYCENLIPELSTLSKTVPFINKWGYMDESKDSCENPYRLNTSKIFDTCNFSANTFMQRGDIMEYTHSMPYYITKRDDFYVDMNEYQYIQDPELGGNNVEEIVNNWISKFSVKKSGNTVDPFDEMFGDTSGSIFGSKRFNRKYSRFLLGNDMTKPTTLFRGVKFELSKFVNGKEICTSEFNDYKFSFIYIPMNLSMDTANRNFIPKMFFVKNDDFKFIVGMVFFCVMNDRINPEVLKNGFNKAFVYSGCMGFDISANNEPDNGDSDIDNND